jgi:hypothetical protein
MHIRSTLNDFTLFLWQTRRIMRRITLLILVTTSACSSDIDDEWLAHRQTTHCNFVSLAYENFTDHLASARVAVDRDSTGASRQRACATAAMGLEGSTQRLFGVSLTAGSLSAPGRTFYSGIYAWGSSSLFYGWPSDCEHGVTQATRRLDEVRARVDDDLDVAVRVCGQLDDPVTIERGI